MIMKPVSSSNLVSVGYDKGTQTLRIAFRSSVYDYYNVPEQTYLGLMSALSKGSYHAAYIKHWYQYKRV